MTTPLPDFVYLLDNGSLRAQATLELRRIAEALEADLDVPVRAVSLLHSHKVDPAELGGTPATILKRRLLADGAAGARRILILPLFLGPSRAISEYMPQVVDTCLAEYPDLQVETADVLCGRSPHEPDVRLVDIMEAQLSCLLAECSGSEVAVALVDHGTPAPEVNELRNALAGLLGARLASQGVAVYACSMERREGPEYAFNEPLLERVGTVLPSGTVARLLVAMCFLLPGRHAGPNGDVAEILDGLVANEVCEDAVMSPLIGTHPDLQAILRDRYAAACARFG